MDTVQKHYDQLLGSVYSWILGDFDRAYKENAQLFDQLGIRPARNAQALDLGAGPGCQSLPLAALGFSVTAIDFCQELLDELQGHPGNEAVRTVLADIRSFADRLDEAPELIVCMGDTLVHLPSHDDAERLLRDIATSIAAGGSVIISIRDYDQPGPTGADRFIPLRSADEQIFTCFLEYEDDVVQVHDLLQRRVNGEWQLSVSGYQKLRVSVDRVVKLLSVAGLTVTHRLEHAGMQVVHARKPA